MEFLTILMTGLLAAGSPIGLIVEEITGDRLSQRLESAETFEVRVDNLPAHKIAHGEIDQLRIAGRGIEIVDGFRLEALELETDPLNIDLQRLRARKFDAQTFREPLQAGLRLVLTEADLNEALNIPQVRRALQPLINRLLFRPGSPKPPQYTLETATMDFVGENRFLFRGTISEINPQTGDRQISELELGYTLKLVSGSEIQWNDGAGTLNGQAIAAPAIAGFSQAMNGRLNLGRFDERGVTARFFALYLDDQSLETALFLRFQGRGDR